MEDSLSAHEALGRAVRVLREERGLRRRDLAEDAGVSYTHLAEIENGKKRPSSDKLAAISEALNVRPFEIMALADSLARGEGMATKVALYEYMAAARIMPTSVDGPEQTVNPASETGPAAGSLEELQRLARDLPEEDRLRLLDLARRLRGD